MVSALVVRLAHYLFGEGHLLEVLLYANDFLYLATDKATVEGIALVIFVLTALGFPFRWDKFRGGSKFP